jgi:hypothetical protein
MKLIFKQLSATSCQDPMEGFLLKKLRDIVLEENGFTRRNMKTGRILENIPTDSWMFFGS